METFIINMIIGQIILQWSYLGTRHALILASWKDTGGGEMDGGGVGREGGGTEVSTFAGSGTTPDIS